jgi:hypothetical protein
VQAPVAASLVSLSALIRNLYSGPVSPGVNTMSFSNRSILAFGLAFVSLAAWAQQDTTTSHGFTLFGDLKYGPDAEYFDYVNPNAPKGGTYRFSFRARATQYAFKKRENVARSRATFLVGYTFNSLLLPCRLCTRPTQVNARQD